MDSDMVDLTSLPLSTEKREKKSRKTRDSAERSERRARKRAQESGTSSPAPLLSQLHPQSQVFQSKALLIDAEQINATKKEQEEITKWIQSPDILLRWENLNKHVDIVKKKRFKKEVTQRQILFDVSGCVRPGEIMALMGPSGSGKTTLLNVLGGRITSQVTGDITLNGERFEKRMKRKVAYVMQQDIFFDQLTVREQLTFTARLRFPMNMDESQKIKQVENIINTLGLTKCANSRIRMVSGGERKRVNIGTELLTNPSLLLLDEPTSGLDSTTSAQLMKTLRLLAMQGKTIVTSIHQPSSQLFSAFDKLLLLADGKTIYSGPPMQVLDYFASVGFLSPPNYNPADFIMDLVNADENPREYLQKKFLEVGINQLDLPPESKPKPPYLADLASEWPTSYLYQLRVLIQRNALTSKSNLFTVLNFVQSVALAVICGLVWLRMEETDRTINDRSGYVFFVMTFWPFNVLFSGLLSFPREREIIMKERASGSYHLSAYFASKAFSEAPIILILPTIFLIISYWMANMNPSFVSFLGFTVAELLCVWAAESIGLFLGATVLDLQNALVVATVSMLGVMLLGGFMVQNIPLFLDWARYLSIFNYAFNACLVVEFTDDRVLECTENPVVPLCQTQDTLTGEETLNILGITGIDRSYGFNVGLLLIIAIFFRILAYLSLRFLNTKHERG